MTPMSDSTTQGIAISHKDTTRQENTESESGLLVSFSCSNDFIDL